MTPCCERAVPNISRIKKIPTHEQCNNILIIKPTRCTDFSNLFWNKTLHVSDSSSVHHQFFTVPTAMVYAESLQVRSAYQDVTSILLASCQQTCMTYTIAVCTVKNSWWWTGELSETCGVLFQNKFEKSVHLVGFIIRIYHDARSPERQKSATIITVGTMILQNFSNYLPNSTSHHIPDAELSNEDLLLENVMRG